MRIARSVSIMGSFLLMSCLNFPTYAQEDSVVQVSVRVPSENTIVVPPRIEQFPTPPRVSTDQEVPRVRRPLGRRFWVSWAALAALTVASTELTMACTHRPGCTEGNPIWGKHPTRLEMYGIRGGLLGAGFLLSRSLRRDGDTWWKLMPAVVIPEVAAETAWDAHMLASYPRGGHSALVANVPASQVEVISTTPPKK